MTDLFSLQRPEIEEIYPEVWVLANYVKTIPLIEKIQTIDASAPFRQMMTPMGYLTQVSMTNCGNWGWVSDQSGYRYEAHDPLTEQAWPNMPKIFQKLATRAADAVGFADFIPDACLINRYDIGNKMGAHKDKDESDFRWPIVSVSIGLSTEFQIYGKARRGKPINYQLHDGDVMVWGGESRLIYHGVKTVKADKQNLSNHYRYNLTFRKAK
ncbi:DNA oxidative demethylase AlkB [Aliikangiella marina]|uniref:DNA oxidative demethylase AlkB n=1 Tax=Aliikangiella marina TaxID=1712262 RepID=A0A545TCL7_9GAMM|nr:DNA oxidative demethylase AlkB [Aliikangiella marina]TQV74962.1 DNA oxidative demethylase AlkB [Aliikangiella marina]